MDCRIVEVEAGSEVHASLRRGRLTASHAGDWIASPGSDRFRDYRELVVKNLLGYEEEELAGPYIAQAKAMDPLARDAYTYKTSQKLTPDLMLIHPQLHFLSGTPDGVWIPDRDGLIKISNKASLTTYQNTVRKLEETGEVEAKYRPQLQCLMLITGLHRVDFVNYFHDEESSVRKIHIFPVARDQDLIDIIEEQAIIFMTDCYKRAARYSNSGNENE